jgi:hypothetical protein
MKTKNKFKPTKAQIVAYWELNNPDIRIDGLTVLEAYYKSPSLRLKARTDMARDMEKITLYLAGF